MHHVLHAPSRASAALVAAVALALAAPAGAAPRASVPLAVPSLPLVASAAKDAGDASPFAVALGIGEGQEAPDGTPIAVHDLHPGTLAHLSARVTNATGGAADASIVFTLPADGSLVAQPVIDRLGYTCAPQRDTRHVECAVPALGPGETRPLELTARLSAAPGTHCASVAAVDGTGAVLASSPDACVTSLPWPAGDAGTGFAVGDVVHDLALLDGTATSRRLSDLRGSYVVLTFTGRWVLPSQAETPSDRDQVAALGRTLGAPIRQLVVLVDGIIPGRQSTPFEAAGYEGLFALPAGSVLATQGDAGLEALQLATGFVPPTGTGVGFPTTVFLTPEGRIFSWRVGQGRPGETAATLRDHPPAPAPVLTRLPEIVGTPTVGGTLHSRIGGWLGADRISVRWLRCPATGDTSACTTIPGATRLVYHPVAEDGGHRLLLRVTAARRETSVAADAIVGAPTARGLRIAGVRRVGARVAVAGTILRAAAVAYAWSRDGVPIPGATGRAYRLREADRGRRVAVQVTATNALGLLAVPVRAVRVAVTSR